MVKQLTRYTVPGMLLASLLIMIFAFSACGSDSSSGASTSGSSSSGTSSAPAQTVNVKESKAAGKDDVYTCNPTTINIKKGDSIQFTNQTDENQDFDGGDSQQAGVDFKLGLNQSMAVPFNTAGTFNITSEKGATIKVTVQ